MRRIALVAVLLVCTALLTTWPRQGSAQSSGPPWSTFHGDQQRDGVSAASGTDSLTFVNEFDLAPGIQSSPAIDAAGTAYIGNNDGNVYALSPSQAQPLWTFATGGPVVSSPSLSPDGKTVYVGSDSGHVFAINTADGHQKWDKNLGGTVRGSPLVSPDGNSIYITDNFGNISALKASDGTNIWGPTSGQGGNYGSLALSPDGATIYFPVHGAYLYGVPVSGPATTTGFTTFYLDSAPTSSPSVDRNGNVYIDTQNGSVQSFSPSTSTARWTISLPSHLAATSTPALVNTLAILGTASNSVVALNQSDGSQSWAFTTGGPVSSSPAIAKGNGRVYVGDQAGNLYDLDLGGTQKATRNLGAAIDASPAIAADGSVWVATEGGRVLRMKDIPAPASPPPAPTGTAVPPATATPQATNTPAATSTPTATATPAVVPLTVSLKASSVKPGKKQTVSVTSAPSTVVKIRVNYPNGDHQSHSVTTDTTGKATYSYKQGASKVKHNKFVATVIATAGTGSSLNRVQQTYTIKWGKIDVSAEPRSLKAGKIVDIFVHTSKSTTVAIQFQSSNGSKTAVFYGKTGSKGLASFKVKLTGAVLKKGQKVRVYAWSSGKGVTSTSFTIK